MDAAAIKSLVSQTPAGRRGQPVKVADAVVFFASDESAFPVGSEFIIDGGMSNLWGAAARSASPPGDQSVAR